MHIDNQQSRRTFLRRSAHLGAAGVAAPLVSSLGLIGEAAAATATGYKALVCVFLYGGNDHYNTLVPYDIASYNAYQKARPNIAVSRGSMSATALQPANSLGGLQYAFNSSLKRLHPLFGQGKVAPIVNVGALVQPTTKAAYNNGSVQLPPKLFSHNDQQSYVQAFAPEGAGAGWGGRMGDLLQSSNGNAALTCISLQGRSLWLSGQTVSPFSAKHDKVTELLWSTNNMLSSGAAYNALTSLMTQPQTSWIADEYTKTAGRALQLTKMVASGLNQVPDTLFTTFSNGNPLSDQLKMVARLIKIGPSMGLSRQVFFVGLGGFDTHSGQPKKHPYLLQTVGNALADFYASTVQHGVANQVTAFTASDFGRSLAENGDGSDHGWGGTQFVVGGAVKGGRIYGTPPAIGFNTSDDVGSGRLIPTTSVDQMAATLALWFGLSPSELPMVMPHMANFNSSSWNLGFL